MTEGPGAAILSTAMIAAFLLGAGGMWLVAKQADVKKGLLMVTAAAVLLANVLIWTM